MKPTMLFSFTLNTSLLLVCGLLLLPERSAVVDFTSVAARSGTVAAREVFLDQNPPEAKAKTEPHSAPEVPGHAERSGYQTLAADLMEQGWPEGDAEAFSIGRIFEDLLNNRLDADSARSYWEATPREERRHSIQEKHRLARAMASFLGIDGPSVLDPDSTPLAPEKRRAIARINDEYASMRREFDPPGDGVSIPEDYDVREKLAEERRRDIEALLSPEELFEYDLRHSGTARTVRDLLSDTEPTEAVFREIFRLQHEHDQVEVVFNPYPDEETKQRRREADEKLQKGLQELLDEETYRQVRRNRRGEYQELLVLVDRLDLPKETANRVFDRTEEVVQLRDQWIDSGLPYPEWRESEEKLGKELRADLTELLGEDGLELYRKNGGSALGMFREFK